MATPQPVYVTVEGKQFQVFVGADNRYYLYDPHKLLDTHALQAPPHTGLPGAEEMPGNGLYGLGAGDQNARAGIAVASTALTFVPVVGPILGPLVGAIGSMFTGGDPTPGNSIWKSIIDEREALAQLRNAVAGQTVDTFTVPAGFDRLSDGPNGGNTANVLATKICNEILNLGTDDIHKVKRATWYKCRDTLAQMIQQLQAQLHDMQLTQSIVSQLRPQTTQVVPATSLTQPTTTQPSTAQTAVTPITQDDLTAAYQRGAMQAAQAAMQYQLPMLAQQNIPSAYPAVYTQPAPAPVASTGSGINQMLPYIALGGMMLVALLANRS